MQNPTLASLLESADPMATFSSWWKLARSQAENEENQAVSMTVSTVNDQGQPSSRIVLLRELTDEHLIFYTNYQSQKGQDLAENPKVGLHFFWTHLSLQVQVLGWAKRTSQATSEAYWNQRARGSQVSQALSLQSQILPPDQSLEQLSDQFEQRNPGPIPCPENWGGYQVTPTQWEFWIGRPNRLHHRVQFQQTPEGSWKPVQLYP